MKGDKKTEEIRRQWDSIYRERSLDELPWEEGKPSAVLVALIESGVVEKGAALDICCGSGENAIYLARHGFSCHGIDISPTAIGYARNKAAREAVSCQLVPGNAIQLPYPDNHFTLVFDRGCFHSISPKGRKAYIRGVHRVLKIEGKYQLLCFSSKDHPSRQPPYSFSPEDIKRYFSRLFKISYIKELSHKVRGGRSFHLSVLMEKMA